jgi:hypothetical protein
MSKVVWLITVRRAVMIMESRYSFIRKIAIVNFRSTPFGSPLLSRKSLGLYRGLRYLVSSQQHRFTQRASNERDLTSHHLMACYTSCSKLIFILGKCMKTTPIQCIQRQEILVSFQTPTSMSTPSIINFPTQMS